MDDYDTVAIFMGIALMAAASEDYANFRLNVYHLFALKSAPSVT